MRSKIDNHYSSTLILVPISRLYGGRADKSVQRRIAVYLRTDLLILDDFGLRALVPPGPEDLYEIINERYEKGSILLTSNRSPAE